MTLDIVLAWFYGAVTLIHLYLLWQIVRPVRPSPQEVPPND